MKRLSGVRCAALLSPAMLLAACAPWGGPRCACSPPVLQARLQARLAPDLASGQASLQSLPDGARVVIPDSALFGDARKTELDENGRLVLARVIEAMLDPHLMHVQFADSSSASAMVQGERARAAARYFDDSRVGPAYLANVSAPGTMPAGSVPQELTITAGIVPR
jgi:hypothetical protein